MFDKIGEKIQKLAIVTCGLGCVASLIGAIALWSANSYYNPTVFLGFVVLAAGVLVSWISSFFVYGFGQLIDDTEAIRSMMTQNANGASASHGDAPIGLSYTNTWRCSKCGTTNPRSVVSCKNCGNYK